MQGNARRPENLVTTGGSSTFLAETIRRASKGRAAAPVDQWDPPICGQLDMRISSDGSWHHEGRPIRRPALVKLFASVLRKDNDGCTYLVTPQEKLAIQVDDAPLVFVDYDAVDEKGAQTLVFHTSVDDVVVVGAQTHVRFVEDPCTLGLKLYVRVRGRLDGLLNRAMTAALLADARFVDLDAEPPVLKSGSARFPIVPQTATGEENE